MADFQDIILRFTAEDAEGKSALEGFAALLKAVGLETAEPEVDLKGVAKAELDLGKLIAALKAIDSTKAQPTISTRTEEGQRAVKLFRESIQQLEDLHAEVRLDVDTTQLKEAEAEVTRLKKKLARQNAALSKFTASDQFSVAGGKTRAGKIRTTEKELAAALEKAQALKAATEQKFDVNLSTLEARTQLGFLRDNLNELAKLVVSPEVRLNDEQARRAAARVRAIMAEITRLRGTAEIDLHSEAFQAKVAEIKREMRNLEGEIARPSVDLQGGPAAEGTIASVSEHLQALGLQEGDPSIQVHGGPEAMAELEAVRLALRDLEGRNVDVDVHVKGRLERLGGILGGIKAAFGAVREEAQGFASSIGRVSVSFGAFTARLGPALIAVLFLLGGAILSIVGGLAALGASAILAAGAVAALAVAFAAALGPAALLAIALFTRLAKVMEALKQRELSRQQAQQQSVAGDQQKIASLRAISDAEENLRRAKENVTKAEVTANRELQDSYERVRDAVLALQHAELDRERAKLGLDRARLELKQFREELALSGHDLDTAFKKFTDISVDFKPTNLTKLLKGTGTSQEDQLNLEEKILNVRDAQLGVKDANDRVKDSETELARARQDNLKFVKLGIKASEGYAAAILAVADAQKALTRAQEDKKMLAAQAKSLVLVQKLSSEERQVLRILEKIKKAFQVAFNPVLAPVWGAFVRILQQIPKFLKRIGPAMFLLGFAVGNILDSFAKALGNPKVAKAFSQFAIAAALLAGSTSRILIDLFTILGEVAQVSMPFLVDMARQFADVLDRWTVWAKTPGNISGVIQVLVDNLKIWLDIAFQLARVFIGFLTGANGPGQTFAKWIRDSLKHLADLLNTTEGRQALIDWLTNAVDTTIGLVKAIVVLIQLFGMMAVPVKAAMDQVVFFFNVILTIVNGIKKIIKLLIDDIKLHFKIFDAILGGWPSKLIRALGDLLSAIPGFAKDIFEKAKSIGEALVDGIVQGLKERILVKKGDTKGLIKKFLINAPLQLLGIGSPSKVWAEMGRNLVRGMEVGLSRGATSLAGTVSHTLAVPALRSPVPALAGGFKETTVRGGDTVQNNQFNIQSPPGTSPDEDTMIAQIDRRLRRIR